MADDRTEHAADNRAGAAALRPGPDRLDALHGADPTAVDRRRLHDGSLQAPERSSARVRRSSAPGRRPAAAPRGGSGRHRCRCGLLCRQHRCSLHGTVPGSVCVAVAPTFIADASFASCGPQAARRQCGDGGGDGAHCRQRAGVLIRVLQGASCSPVFCMRAARSRSRRVHHDAVSGVVAMPAVRAKHCGPSAAPPSVGRR